MSQKYGQATVDEPMSSLQAESLDRIFGALADERRRDAVAYLVDTQGAVSRTELVDHVADDHPGIDDERLQRLAVQFHHRHLPKLAAAGLVNYDDEDETVYATETADRVSRWFADV